MIADLLQKACYHLEERLLGGARRSAPVFNVCGRNETDYSRRALLVYMARPFRLRKNHAAFRHHQSFRQATQIAAVLDSFGFIVDAVEIGDRSFKAQRCYDLLINHRVDYEGLEAAIGPNTLKVYLSSGMNHIVHNQNQKARAAWFTQRKGHAPKGLIWDPEEMPYLKIADALVGFGNQTTMDSWKSAFAGPIYRFENYSLAVPQVGARDPDSARKHFLFFGSKQQVGKGLDLLLDVFARAPELHLWVCSHYRHEPDFCAVYNHELFQTPSIHACGFVDIGGKRFRKAASECGFVIHPSCSEGSPGSVINAMATGLVPILSKESGVDGGEGGITLADCRIETIAEAVRLASQMSPAELRARSQKVLRLCAERYSEKRFIERWGEIVKAFTKQ